jgi:hypothetical protein
VAVLNVGPGAGAGADAGAGAHNVEVGEEILTDDEEISEGSKDEDKEEGSRKRAVKAVKRRSNSRSRIA